MAFTSLSRIDKPFKVKHEWDNVKWPWENRGQSCESCMVCVTRELNNQLISLRMAIVESDILKEVIRQPADIGV